MKQQEGDLWAARQKGDWVVITTNGALRQDGALVMGRGIALEAATRYKWLQKFLGDAIKQNGLRVELEHVTKLIAFPVKHHYLDKADINLILKSTLQLLEVVSHFEGRILMPRPGCGFGRLDWAEVEPMLQHYLTDSRFIIFHKPGAPRVVR